MMDKECFEPCDKSVELEALWDSGIAHSEAHGVLYIRGDCVPVGEYKAYWNGTDWELTLPEGVVEL